MSDIKVRSLPAIRAFGALLAKDWRLFQVPLVSLIIVGIGPYVVGFFVMDRNHSMDSQSLMMFVNEASSSALLLTALLASVFGGTAIAGERAGRSAEFLAMLPITRWQIVLSKWVMTVMLIGSCVAVHAAISLTAGVLNPFNFSNLKQISFSAVVLMGLTVCFFGVAWLLSAITRSPPISASVSICVTLVTMVCLTAAVEGTTGNRAPLVFSVATFAIGLPCLVAGTIYYLRRIAP